MADYLVVTSPENWKKTADMGWKLLGLKSTRHNVATSLRKGDRLACYETGVKHFIAVITIDGDCYEDHTPIWGGKKAGEDYPYRYPIKPVVAVDESQALDAVALSQELEFPEEMGDAPLARVPGQHQADSRRGHRSHRRRPARGELRYGIACLSRMTCHR